MAKKLLPNGATLIVSSQNRTPAISRDWFPEHDSSLFGPGMLSLASGNEQWTCQATDKSGATWYYLYGGIGTAVDKDAEQVAFDSALWDSWHTAAVGEKYNAWLRRTCNAKMTYADLIAYINAH